MHRLVPAVGLLCLVGFACSTAGSGGDDPRAFAMGSAASAPRAQEASAPSAAAADVLTPHKVASLRAVSAAAVSPDGKHVAYTLSVPRKPMVDDDGAPWVELHVLDVASGASRAFITGKVNVSAIDWTPDGTGIAFLSKRGEDKETALWVIPVAGGEAAKAVGMKSSISAYSFASDGKRVAVLATEPEDEKVKKAKDKGFAQEVYEEDAKYVRAWIATAFDDEQKPTALPIEASVRQLEWSPVAEQLLVSATPTPLVDDEYMRHRVFTVDASTGKELWTPQGREGKLGQIGWSADGSHVAYISAADIHDPSAGRLRVTEVAKARAVTQLGEVAPEDGDTSAFAWMSGNRIAAVVHKGVDSYIAAETVGSDAKLAGPAPEGGPNMTSVSISRDGSVVAVVASSPEHPPELYVRAGGSSEFTRRTDSNPWLAGMRLAKQEVVKHEARDGLELEGILIRPLDEQPGTRYPLLVAVHGGPEAHISNGWLTSYSNPGQMAAARGFAVFYPNYRGSTGRGVAFSKLSQGDPAGKEFDDLVDAVDHLVSTGLVDAKRVGVTGGSYGGYATAWCSTKHSGRFAAGVMMVGISDKVSKVGTTDIPDEEYYVHALHRPWEKWDFLLERSPITHAGESKTPLLILHGKDDPRVNPGQSREMYRHMKLRSQAPVRLVLYPGEGHGNRKSASRLDYSLRMMQWFEHYLAGPGGEPPAYQLDYADPAEKPAEAEPKLQSLGYVGN